MVRAGDPTAEEVTRRYRAPSTAVTNDLKRVSGAVPWRGLLLALLPIGFVGGVVVGFLDIDVAFGAREPVAVAVAAFALILAYAGLVATRFWRALDGNAGRVLDVVAWAAREARQEWAAASPGSRPPRSPNQARRWLAAHPETDTNRPQRVAASLMAGDLSGARETLQRYPVTSPLERHHRAADRLAVDVIAGATVTAAEIDTVYVELGEEHRAHAIACRSVTEASAAVLSGADWRAPLLRAWPELPAEAVSTGRRQAWLILVVLHVAIFAVLIGVVTAAWLLLTG